MANLSKASLTTLTLKKNGGSATLTLIREGDGSMKFTAPNGVVRRVDSSNVDFKDFHDVLAALDV